MEKLIKTLVIAATFAPWTCLAEQRLPSEELPPERAGIRSAFDLSRPLLLRDDAPYAVERLDWEDDLPPDPAPPNPDDTPAQKRLAQLERAATEASTIHTLGRLAKLAERLGYDEPAVRDAAFQLASWAYTSRGRQRAEEGRADEALEDFDRAVELTPGDPTPLHDKAVSLAERGDDLGALEAFDGVIDAEPGWVAARRNRATVLLRLGDAEGALADCQHALGLADEGAEGAERARLHELAGRAMQLLGRSREGARSAESGLAESPHDPALLTLRGDLSAELGLVERAIDDYFAALEGDPTNPELYRRLAWLLATCPDKRLRDPRLAVQAAARARRLGYDGDPLTLDASAAAHAAAGDFAGAIRFQQRAILVAGENASRSMNERLALYRGEKSYVAAAATAGAGIDSSVRQAGYQGRGRRR